MVKRFFLIAVWLLCLGDILAQTRAIDSLDQLIERADSDEKKLSGIYEILELNYDADSTLKYLQKAEAIAKQTKQKADDDMAAYYRAGYYIRKNISDSALDIIERLVAKYKDKKEDQSFYLKFLFFKAKVLDRSNQYTKALADLVDVIETAGNLRDTSILIKAKTGIGWVQMEMAQYNEALQWLYRAKSTSADPRFYKNYGALYSNIASAYNSLHNADSAIHYINIAIRDARENDNLLFLATALSMQAQIFIDNKQPALAESPLHEVVIIRKQLNDPFYTVYDMSSLASYYANNGQTDKGIELCKEGIAIAKQRGLSSQLLMIYRALAENYKAADMTPDYSHTLESIIALKDSFNNINSSKQLAELQAANETQKNERTIIQQKLDLTKKNYWLYGSSLFILMAVIIAWLAFKVYRRRQELKMHSIREEEKRISALAVMHAEEHERKRIAADLHDNLGSYAASIASNLDHISIHQFNVHAAAPLQELRNNSQAIVSQLSDTIWVLKKDALSLTAISDRVKVFIQRIQPSYPGVAIDVLEDIRHDHLVQPSQAFHLFRIIQEAINNALKHSQCKTIVVRINGTETWSVSIEDDGKGWQEATATTPTTGGNGIINMKSRVKEAGWTISWDSDGHPGTHVWIRPEN
jgi:signal transduction histidine kinase